MLTLTHVDLPVFARLLLSQTEQNQVQAMRIDVAQAIGSVKDLLAQRMESEDVWEKAVLNLLAFDNPNKVDKVRSEGRAQADDS